MDSEEGVWHIPLLADPGRADRYQDRLLALHVHLLERSDDAGYCISANRDFGCHFQGRAADTGDYDFGKAGIESEEFGGGGDVEDVAASD